MIRSAIAFGGAPREVLNLAVTGKISNYISEDIIGEVKEVLQRHKFGCYTLKIKAVVHELELISGYINPERIADAMNHANFFIQDYDDNYISTCAFAAQDGHLVTGDSDLLVLKEDLRQRIKILTPPEFIKDFKQEKSSCSSRSSDAIVTAYSFCSMLDVIAATFKDLYHIKAGLVIYFYDTSIP